MHHAPLFRPFDVRLALDSDHAECAFDKCVVRNSGPLLSISELTDLQDLIQQLRVTYEKVVEGEGSALIGAKSVVATAVHFYHNHGHVDVPVCLVF